MSEITFPPPVFGQSVIVDVGYGIQNAEIVKIDDWANDSGSQLGFLFSVKIPGSLIRTVSRLEVYAMPEEMGRLERDTEAKIAGLANAVDRLKNGGSL